MTLGRKLAEDGVHIVRYLKKREIRWSLSIWSPSSNLVRQVTCPDYTDGPARQSPRKSPEAVETPGDRS